MTASTKSKLLIFSFILSLISICTTVVINYQIAEEYLRADPKTQALFGIIELLQFGYQYYVSVLAVVSLTIAIIGQTGNDTYAKKSIPLLLSLIAITIIFLRIWRVFV